VWDDGELETWVTDTFFEEGQGGDRVLRGWNALGSGVVKADFFRYLVLYRSGGGLAWTTPSTGVFTPFPFPFFACSTPWALGSRLRY
jgi:hypothetical protein